MLELLLLAYLVEECVQHVHGEHIAHFSMQWNPKEEQR